uniref:Chlorophyllase n=1 Tax=Alexandrium catenella TaxID=2925 RepID=A0A7S1MM99_ALECA
MVGLLVKGLWAVLLLASNARVDGLALQFGKLHSFGHQQAAFRLVSVPYRSIVAPPGDVAGLPAQYSLGELLAYVPSAPVTSELLVFLPGSGSFCGNYTQFLTTLGGHIRTLCLPYDNLDTIASLCGLNNRCYPDLRLEAFNGTFAGVHGNNIETRLAEALTYLSQHDSSSWSTYLSMPSGLPAWSRVRLSGHSQGAGHAAIIGYYREVARVVQFSGVCDRSDWTAKLGPPVTPASRFYGFASRWDVTCPTNEQQLASWRAEGGLPPGIEPIHLHSFAEMQMSRLDLDGSHFVVSDFIPPGCELATMLHDEDCMDRAHQSTAENVWPEAPYANGVWQGLCGV